MKLWPEKRWAKALVILGCLVFVMVLLHLPIPQKIKIGPDTTVISGPLNPDGTVNYVAALDAICAKGVTAENNAAPLLLEALGPEVIAEKVRDKVLERLAIRLEPNAPGRFVAWENRTQRQTPTTTSCPSQPAEPLEAIAAKKVEKSQQETTTRPDGELSEDAEKSEDTGPCDGDIMDMLDEGQVHPDLEPWLKENAKALDLVTQACQRPRLYIPLVSQSDPPTCDDLLLSTNSSMRAVAKALVMRAGYRHTQGDLVGAWSDVLTTHRLARLVAQEPMLIEYLVATAIDSLAATEAQSLATHGGLTAQQAKDMLKDMDNLDPVGDLARCFDRSERFYFLDMLTMLRRGRIEGFGFQGYEQMQMFKESLLDYNLMMRITNKWYDRIVEAEKLPSMEGRKQALQALSAEVEAAVQRTVQPGNIAKMVAMGIAGWPARKYVTEGITNLLLGNLLPPVEMLVDVEGQYNQRYDLERLALAMAGYHAQNGRWPRELGELVPAFLEAIPPDRFSGKALIYKPTEKGYTLYGVGMNRKDDGGSDVRKRGKDDIVVSVK